MRRAREVITGVALCVCLLGAGFPEPRVTQESISCTQTDQNHYTCEFFPECSNLDAMGAYCAAMAWIYGWVVEGVACNETEGACLFHLPS
jgi:hypothetical protein